MTDQEQQTPPRIEVHTEVYDDVIEINVDLEQIHMRLVLPNNEEEIDTDSMQILFAAWPSIAATVFEALAERAAEDG